MSKLKKLLCAFALVATTSAFASIAKIDTENSVNAASERRPLALLDRVTISDDGTRVSRFKTRGIVVVVQQDAQGRVIRSQVEGANEARHIHYNTQSIQGLPIAVSTENLETGAVRYRVLPGVSRDTSKYLLVIQDPDEFDPDTISFIIEDPFGIGWEIIDLVGSDPSKCSKDDCKDICAAGAGVGSLGCVGIGVANPAVGIVCEAIILGGWAKCVERCNQRCR